LRCYLDLLQQILEHGEEVPTGAFLPSQNRQPHALTILGAQFRHDLATGFPAVTTKKFYFESMVKEILWFLRGETNTETLGCGIWDQWAGKDGRPEGECGPIYGATWRHWNYLTPGCPLMSVGGAFDQVTHLVEDLKAVAADPYNRARRRIILTGWNPPLVPLMGLPPCHTLAQFLPTNGRLNCHCFWRSIDAPVGMPFNIGQYAFLTHLFAGVAGLKPGVLVASVTDLHIYDNQHDMVREQLSRAPLPHPQLEIDPEVWQRAPDFTVEQVRSLTPEMFRLKGYSSYGPLRCEVAV